MSTRAETAAKIEVILTAATNETQCRELLIDLIHDQAAIITLQGKLIKLLEAQNENHIHNAML